ncbi:unnamed protein product [Nyctereutes procyonoides]|uniref:(raccoon dog) hypothetical protein n=1 Tax=Nyctereutes procyonoides TaxID=34880 RepID=A0A811YT22_NYCPR|nr:unnamed protein product [Nyctereutes procyonoides]
MKTSMGALIMFWWLMWSHILHLSVQDGNSTAINWSYSDSGSDYFPSYKQEFGKGPQLMIDRHSFLSTQPEDSAVYFCAASTLCFRGTCCLHSTL